MKKITLFTLLTLLLCTSCVTKKKFMLAEMAATASKDSLQGLLNNSREVGNQLSAQVKNLLRDTNKLGCTGGKFTGSGKKIGYGKIFRLCDR